MPDPVLAHRPDPPPPSVPADAYDRDYFLDHCVGFEQWSSSNGRDADGRYLGCLARARMQPGDRVIDIGTARGELLPVAVEQGAAWALGIDYSADSVALAHRTIAAHGAAGRCLAIQADCQALPLASDCADLVFMLDVVEHLTPAELENTLAEAHRVLRPGGRLFIHTFPTSTVYNVTYRLQRWLLPWRLRTWPADPRTPFERRMHVNEQTCASLRRALDVSAPFESIDVRLGEWIHTVFVPAERSRAVYHRLASHRLTARFGVANIWAEATKPQAA